MPAPARSPYQYAVIRVVPRVERGERLNAGVVLLCRPRRFLAARVFLDRACLAALSPATDPAEVQAHLEAIVRIAVGDAAGGPLARLSQPERFHQLSAPASTIIQPGSVHTGLTTDPAATLDRLFALLVARPGKEE